MRFRKLLFGVLFAVLILFILFLGKETLMGKRETVMEDSTNHTYEMRLLPLVEIEGNQKRMVVRRKYSSDEFQAGMNILMYGHPDMMEIHSVFEHLRSLGINSVALNIPFFQSDWQANEVSTSQVDTPTRKELREIIELAHASGLSVMIRPIMDEQAFLSSNRWRGQIEPSNPNQWFDSYQELILSYATLAEHTKAKSLNIGTELSSMQHQYQERWKELIENVRRVYNGELLYSFNYDTVSDIPSIKFVELLDYIGIDAYFSLNLPDKASIEMLEEEWERQLNQLHESLWNEPIVVTEVGIVPVAGAHRTPYAWDFPNGTYDAQAQSNYYEATFQVWKPKVDGLYWWSVSIGGDSNEISYSPLSLPAEEVIKKHYLLGQQDS